jgi:hypothetical protein
VERQETLNSEGPYDFTEPVFDQDQRNLTVPRKVPVAPYLLDVLLLQISARYYQC